MSNSKPILSWDEDLNSSNVATQFPSYYKEKKSQPALKMKPLLRKRYHPLKTTQTPYKWGQPEFEPKIK